MPTIAWEFRWSIAVYEGSGPLALRPASLENPVLTARSVTDVPCGFVADPFHVRAGDFLYLFFEVWNDAAGRGEIAYATSTDARNWSYREVVLREPFHLSYPCIVRDGDDFFMIPETRQCAAVRLYRADELPHRWTFVRELVHGDFADATPFFHEDRWWMFVHRGLDELRLFSASALDGDWTEHPKSPIVAGNRSLSRPAGRVLPVDGRLLRFAQDGWPQYGTNVRAIAIDVLTATDYAEHELPESPILEASGDGWNSLGMHHVDFIRGDGDRWTAVVDGYTPGGVSFAGDA